MRHKIKNFSHPIHLACSTDYLKPNLMLVNFQDGYVWATDGHLLARQSLDLIHGFDKEEIAILEGKRIHKDMFALIYKYDCIVVKEEGLEVVMYGGRVLFPYYKSEDAMPNYKQAISIIAEEKIPLSEVGMSAKLIAIADKILNGVSGQYRFQFTRKDRMVFISTTIHDIKYNFVLLMPVMVTGDDYGQDLKTLL